jgi:ribosomal protein S21
MAIYAHRKGSESNDALMQRFKKQVQKTGLMKLLRTRQAFRKSDSKRATRMKAVKREEYRAKNRKQQFYSNM